MTHSEIQDSLGAFAVDALDADEKRQIEDHLAECPRCRAELGEYRETAALLADPTDVAPTKLWERIAGTLETAPPGLDLVRAPRSRLLTVRAGFAAGVAAILLAGFMGFKVNRLDDRLDRVTQAMSANTLERAAEAALMNPKSVRVDLASNNDVIARVVVLPDGQGYLIDDKLRPLGPDRTYQLWALSGDERISLGVLGPNPTLSAFKIHGDIQGFAITEEAAGGVGATSADPAAVGWL